MWIPDLAISILAHLTWLGNTDPQHSLEPKGVEGNQVETKRVQTEMCAPTSPPILHFTLTRGEAGRSAASVHRSISASSGHTNAVIQVGSRGTQVRSFTHRTSLGVEFGVEGSIWGVWEGSQLRGCGCCVVCLLFRA